MKLVYQRVSRAKIIVNKSESQAMGRGCVLFLGIDKGDEDGALELLLTKALNLRCFPKDPANPKMDLSVRDIRGAVMLVSQFTLCASHKKGNRPDFMNAEAPERAKALYEKGISFLKRQTEITLITGQFGAHMDVELINDGPVTFIF